MMRKLKTFINSKNKMSLIKQKVRIEWQKIYYNYKFQRFGDKSELIRPIRLLREDKINIGNNVCILNGARMEVISEWRGHHYDAEIVIGDNVSIGQNFHITSASSLVIGDNTTILGNVFVTNIDHNYQEINVNISNQEINVKETTIGDNCFIGYGAAIQAGTVLGKQCIVGTNAVVRGHYEDYSVIVGAPAKVIKKYNFKTKLWERV